MINDTIKEHLFGPDLTYTDDNSPHSPESGDEGTLKYTPFILFLVLYLGGGTAIHGLYKYVLLQRVWCSSS